MRALLAILLVLVFTNIAISQDVCDDFKIVGIYDMPPGPGAPGGNYFVMLLSLTADLPGNVDPYYANLFFINIAGDTISGPFGQNMTLPRYTSDTIPYLMQLYTELSNQDFPEPFDGWLVIRTSNGEICEAPYSTLLSSNNFIPDEENVISVFPNPFIDAFSIETNVPLEKYWIINQLGQVVWADNSENVLRVRFPEGAGSVFYLMAQLKDGEGVTTKILRVE